MMNRMKLLYAPPALSPRRGFKRMASALLLVAGGVLVYVAVYGRTGGPLRRLHEEVDLNSGRIRRTHYVLLFQTSQHIEQTALSKSQANPPASGPNWRLSRAMGGGRSIGTHWGYRSPLTQVRILEALWEVGDLTDEAKQQVADTVLALWHSEGGLKEADDYLRSIEDVVTELQDAPLRRRITPADLPSRGSATRPNGS